MFLRVPVPVDNLPSLGSRADWVHSGMRCSLCSVNPIVEFRYFCTQCAVSFREKCEFLRREDHDWTHSLLKMGKPEMGITERSTDLPENYQAAEKGQGHLT